MEHCNGLGAICSVLVALLLLTTNTQPCSAARSVPLQSDTQFIRTRCGATTYPQLCYQSLSSYAAAIQTSPQQLAQTALSVSLAGAQSASTMMARLSTSRGLRPREAGATKDCMENMASSVDELRQSMAQMDRLRGPGFEAHMSDIETWVSAALTDEDTCMDGFAGKAMDGKVKNMVRGRVVNVAQLTSNALALINALASVHSQSP